MNEYSIIRLFESTIAKFAGSKYAVAVDSCTSALFLSLMYCKVGGERITIPSKTYISVPCSIIHAGGIPVFKNIKWKGIYPLSPYPIIDGALRFTKNMYVRGSLHCLSFHIKKHLNMGKGGMILTDDKRAYEWLIKARYNGRSGVDYMKERFNLVGWNMYMTPEDASRGIRIFKTLPIINKDKHCCYPDLSRYKFGLSGEPIKLLK
jgi:dTDP-4-amino-4,6-dideoxygalactose transaminase